MAPSKRCRKRKDPQKDGDSTDTFTLERVIDSGIIYGRSLPISRLRALIKGEILELNLKEPREDVSQFANLLHNFRLFLNNLCKRAVTGDYLGKPGFSRYFKTNFNAYWSDYEYGPPCGLEIVGRGGLGFLDSTNPVLDVSIKLPSDIFNPKDHINYRYLNKRNAWLCCLYEDLVSSISKGPECDLLSGMKAKVLKAELLFREPKVYIELYLFDGEQCFTLRVLTHIDESLFKKVSLVPSRNNVRIPTTLDSANDIKEPVNESDLRPTPTYNASILDDLLREPINRKLKDYFSRYEKLKDAVVLMTVWARIQGLMNFDLSNGTEFNRSTHNSGIAATNVIKHPPAGTSVSKLTTSKGTNVEQNPMKDGMEPAFYNGSIVYDNGLSGFILSILLYHAAQCSDLPPEIEAFPLFLCAVKFIASMDTNKFVYSLGVAKPILKSEDEGMQTELNLDLPMFFIDDDRSVNLLYRMGLTFQEVTGKAQATLMATSNMSSPFLYSQLFELPYSLYCHNDVVILVKGCKLGSTFNIWELSRAEYTAAKIRSVLEYGLKDRLHHLHFRFNGNDDLLVLIGLDDSVQRTTDVGPPANSEEAVYYRDFWKGFTETRSFDDGSICECLLWTKLESESAPTGTCSSSLDFITGININVRILEILLRIHFREYGLKINSKWGKSESDSFINSVEKRSILLVDPPLVEYNNRIATEHRLKLMKAYNELSEVLRGLENVPLKLSNIVMCSSAFGYCDVGNQKLRQKLLLDLETSAKWPNGEKEIRHTKVALGILILKELYKSHDIKSKINEHGDMDLTMMGIKFRMSIVCQKETQEIIKTIKEFDINVDKKPSEPQIAKVSDYIKSQQVDRCKVMALKNPSFSSSVLLCKAFCNSALLPDCDFLCEMLNCYIFGSQEFMHPPPHSGNAGFMRFMYLMVFYDWSSHPLIITDEGKAEYSLIGKKKPSWVPYIWISVSEDPFCLVPRMPSVMLSKRFIGQCKRFLSMIELNFMKSSNLNSFLDLEQHGFNVMLELENIHSNLKYTAKSETLKLSVDEAVYVLETFLESLRATYEGIVELAYNGLELRGLHRSERPLRLFLKFNPLATIPSIHPKAHLPQHTITDADRVIHILNMPALINGICCMGEGIIRRVIFL